MIKKSLSTTYVYIDDSIDEQASLATLTAIFIPERKILRVTQEYYKIIKKILNRIYNQSDNKIIQTQLVLHAKDFLRNSNDNKHINFDSIDDEFRISVLKDILQIIEKFKIRIARIGYSNYKEIREAKLHDYKMFNSNWFGLSRYINNFTRYSKVICIMEGEGIEMINKISNLTSTAKFIKYVYPDFSSNITYKNCRKFIGNVYYVPARYSEHLQIADIVSYILHKKDFIDITGRKTKFNKSLYNLYFEINSKRLFNSVIKMDIENIRHH